MGSNPQEYRQIELNLVFVFSALGLFLEATYLLYLFPKATVLFSVQVLESEEEKLQFQRCLLMRKMAGQQRMLLSLMAQITPTISPTDRIPQRYNTRLAND